MTMRKWLLGVTPGIAMGIAMMIAAVLCFPSAHAQSLGSLPATFKGDLPCADCNAIQYQLNLFADNSYDLLMIYRGRSGRGVSESGQWRIGHDTKNLMLLSDRSATIQLKIVNTNSLRLLNQDGTAIVSTLNYSLTRDVQPAASLLDTNWRLTRLRDQPARRFENQREPQIVLRSNGSVTGSDGCNRLTGSYRQADSKLSFSQMASTRMACINGMEQAARFTSALGDAARYRVTGRHLELFDANGAALMRFEAVFVQ
jgi:copper homeostasis protein (lipoprotein)